MTTDQDHLENDSRRPARGILTMGELREFTKDLPDTTQVIVSTPDWYVNVDMVVLPETVDGTHGTMAVTLFPGDPLDTRQF